MRTYMRRTILLLAIAFVLSAADSDQAAVKQVTAAMESLRQAMLHKDATALDRLLNDDLMYTHSAGKVETKADVIKSIGGGKSIVEKLEFSNTTVRIHGTTALVNGRVDLWHSATDLVPMNILHVWVKQKDGWRLASRQATRLAK